MEEEDMSRALIPLVLSSSALWVAVGRADDSTAKPKAADSPEQAVKLLDEAARAGDVDAFLAQLGGHARAVTEMGRAFEAFFTAMDARFGKDPDRGSGPTVQAQLDRYKAETHRVRNRVVRGDDRVDLTVWVVTRTKAGKEEIQEESWTSLKEASGWKIIFTDKGVAKKAMRKDSDGREVQVTVIENRGYDAASSAEAEKECRTAIRLLAEFTKDVKAGKYATREKALEAFDEAKQRIRD
jgi:hypothetical protein